MARCVSLVRHALEVLQHIHIFEAVALLVQLRQLGELLQVNHHFGLLAILVDIDRRRMLILKIFNLNSIVLIGVIVEWAYSFPKSFVDGALSDVWVSIWSQTFNSWNTSKLIRCLECIFNWDVYLTCSKLWIYLLLGKQLAWLLSLFFKYLLNFRLELINVSIVISGLKSIV